jgi:hypothetical protein
MTTDDGIDRLLFADLLPALRGAGQQPWVVGNGVWDEERESRSCYSALIPQEYVAATLTTPDLETQMGEDGPTVWTSGRGVHTYHRTGYNHGIESLVITRSFNGIRPRFVELLEEYRLFHNLLFDADSASYVRFDSAGEPEEIARIEDTRARLLLRPLRQFLAWKEASLALYTVCNRYEKKGLTELGLKPTRGEILRDDISIFCRTVVPCDFKEGFRTFSRLLGKVIIEPLLKEQSDWGPYKVERNYASFVTEVDENGVNVELSCAPEVSEYHYLTPIWFRSGVLRKYQDDPDKYSVVDGLLSCVGLWDLPIDNDHERHVVVFLGDLRDIPEADQLHWKASNIPPQGRLSETAVRRSLYGEWAISANPEHKFANAYMKFMKFSETRGMFVIRPLNDGDSHCLKTLHIPHTDNVMEFDQEVLKLTKLLVDSINDSELEKHITPTRDEKSLSKLERYLVAKGRTDHAPHIAFLRRLQRYRSTNAAHRRGSDAKKAFDALAEGVASSRRETLTALLCSAIDLLDYLTVVETPAEPSASAPSTDSGS